MVEHVNNFEVSSSILAPCRTIDQNRMIRAMYGEGSLHLFNDLAKLTDLSHVSETRQEQLGNADDVFFRNMQRRYGESAANPEQLYQDSMGEANKAMLYIIKTAFPDDTDTFRLRNETLAYGASPSMRLWRAISPSTSALVQHELKRQFLVADISAGIGKMGLERGFRTTLETLQTVIDEQLFKGPSGETENTVMYSLHGENNECLHYSESRDELRAGYSQVLSSGLCKRHLLSIY